jgi:hypothetical protein
MLSIIDPSRRLGRREVLRIGGWGLAGAALPGLWASNSAAAPLQSLVRDKSVVLLFMHGGPSQIETFDPKMSAPADIRSATGEVQTTLPGITFGGTFTRLAKLAHQMTIVRSFAAGDGNHDIKPVVGKDTLHANLGSLYARVAGLTHPYTGMPTNAAIFPRSVDDSTQPHTEAFGRFHATGTLGAAYAPFTPGAGGQFQKDMQLVLARERLDDRRALLASLDQLKRNVDATGSLDGIDSFRQQAFSTILSGVAEAFDLSKEDPKTLARYDTSPLVRPENIDKKWKNYNNYVDHGKTLGKLMLLARRLCENGCRFVLVTTNFVWDNHSDVNNAGVEEGMRYCGLPFDHAVSAFIEDVHARGLSDKILLVATGEIGRTPRINKAGGRDHWGNLTPLMFSGGGLSMGKVIGQSSRDAGEPATQRYTIKHLVATILHAMLDVGQLRIAREVPTDVARVALEEPIPGLL